jgi:RNA-binding protein Tab2/Atab2
MANLWELDFYSRPVLDENQKKIWEVLICDSPTGIKPSGQKPLRFSQICPNSTVNSAWLKDAIEAAIAETGTSPDGIRFFRQAMGNMIVKACEDAGLKAQLSRRTLTLNHWLDQRMREVYPAMEGYQPSGGNQSVAFVSTPPQPLPDALRGEKWQLVTLEASAFDDMGEWEIGFGEAFPLELTGVGTEAMIPGILVFSSRAKPLAAWMSGLELGRVKYEAPDRLLLETGLDERWNLSGLRQSELQMEAAAFEKAKRRAQGVHFLAIQVDPDQTSFEGFWLMQDSECRALLPLAPA